MSVHIILSRSLLLSLYVMAEPAERECVYGMSMMVPVNQFLLMFELLL